jgi:hypothetical protein
MSLVTPVRFGYGYRDHGPAVLTEQAPFGRPAGDRTDPHLAAMLSTEQQAFSAPEGIALRYGLLYGGDAPQLRALLARRGHHGRAGARSGRPGLQRGRRPARHLAGGLQGHGQGVRGPAATPASRAGCSGWQPTFPTYRDGIRAAATEEVPWRSHGRSDAGTRSA